jgi:hypothetical protein
VSKLCALPPRGVIISVLLFCALRYINSDWSLIEKLLIFSNIKNHTGAAMAEVVGCTLDDYGIANRVGCITMDNASNNDTLISALSESINQHRSEHPTSKH